MCGIAGMIDLSGRRPAPPGVVPSMARAIVHRGPDEDGLFDATGLNLIFTCFAMPGPVTVFDGISCLVPGRFLHFKLGQASPAEATRQRGYWQVSYPDRGHEDYGSDEKRVIDGFEEVLFAAVNKRLRADVPVVSYLSGGVDLSA